MTGTFTYSPLAGVVLTPGSYTLSVTFNPTSPDDSTYSAATGSVTLVVNPKSITVTAEVKSKTYGSSDPGLTYTTAVGALVGSDSLSGLLVRATGENAGTYSINQGTLTTGNNPYYVINYVSANLTIDRKSVTITADTLSKTYGAADPALTFTFTSGALQPGDSLNGALSRASGNSFGTYAISQNTITNLNNPNYNITYAPANFTVNKKPITMSVSVANKEYDGQVPATIASTTLNDVEAGDTVTVDATKVSGVFGDPDVGVGKSVTVTLAANVLTGTHSGNYSVTVAGTPLANISTRAVTITADNMTKSASAPDPTFTYSVTSGSIVNRLLVAQIYTGSLTRASLGTNTPGTYSITFGTLALSANYQITFIPGTLTISDKTVPVICWSNPIAITYGTELSATQLNATAREVCGSGSDLPGTFTYTPASGVVLVPGTHSLSVSFAPTDSVTYSTATGTVNILVNPKGINVVADPQTKAYGASDPTLTYSTAPGALVGSDSLTGTLSRVAGNNVGTYPITQGTLSSANNPKYSITFTAANLTITTKTITVTADSKSGIAGTPTTFTVSAGAGEIVAPDVLSGVTFTFSGGGYGPSTTQPASAGSYTTTPSAATFSTGSASNYTINYVAGTLTLSAAAAPQPPTPTPAPTAPVKTAPVVVTKTLPVKKVTLTSTATGKSAIVLGMIASTTGSTSNQASLAPVPNAMVREAVVVGAALPSGPSTSVSSGDSASGSNAPSNGGNSGQKVSPPSEAPEVINVIENKPAFVTDLSAKIAVSLDMDESKTQVRDERVIVQLNSNTGQIRVQPLNGWTGILNVPTYMATDEAIIEIENIITVNPDPTPKVLVRPTAINRTALGWTKSPTESVQKYEVRVNNKLVCETEATTCAVKQLIGPKTKVDVTAIGSEGTRSSVQLGQYSPNKRVKVFTINFDEEKWDFTPTAIQKLNGYIEIIQREGFNQAFVLGYTDSQGSPSTSVPLSRKRATNTTKYLKERLPGIVFKWFAFGEADPLRKGLNPEDFAVNRRAEIYVK